MNYPEMTPSSSRAGAKTVRSSGAVSFVQINDGSTFADLQIAVDATCPDQALVGRLSTGCNVRIAHAYQQTTNWRRQRPPM